MRPNDRFSRNRRDVVVALASGHGFSCTENEKGRWEITPGSDEQSPKQPLTQSSIQSPTPSSAQLQWKLCEQGDRWLLIVQETPQILLRVSEAIAFINRQANVET
ncbi:MAG: hypothetical protein AAFQ63_14935 [Cyanobacteria bacterium J06621_11]